MIRNEVKRLVKLGVLEKANDSELLAPSFAQPKPKTNCVRILSNFWNLNMQFKLNIYPMPKIRGILLKLESFSIRCVNGLKHGILS